MLRNAGVGCRPYSLLTRPSIRKEEDDNSTEKATASTGGGRDDGGDFRLPPNLAAAKGLAYRQGLGPLSSPGSFYAHWVSEKSRGC